MLRGWIILLLSFKSSVVRGLTENDHNTCVDRISREYYCCSNYEKINDKCIKCKLGFMSRKGNSFEPCVLNYYGNDCSRKCMCKKLQRCDNVEGCVDIESRSTLTITSNIAEIISSEESVKKVYKEEKDDGLSKTELLTLFCGVLSGIIVILGFLGILNFVKKRACILKSKRDKPTEEMHISEEPEMQQAFALHESFYETIDDRHLDSISLPQTCNPNPGNDNASQSSRSSTTYNDDQSSYLDPVSSPNAKKSSFRKQKQSKKTVPPARKSTCLENQMAFSPNLESDDKSAIFGCSTNCNDDRLKYLQPVSNLIVHYSSCQKEENSIYIYPSENKSTSIENQTSFSPYLKIDDKSSSSGSSTNCNNDKSIYIQPFDSLITKEESRINEVFRDISANNSSCIADNTSCDPHVDIEEDDSDDSSSKFSENATHDRSSYLHPYNSLFKKFHRVTYMKHAKINRFPSRMRRKCNRMEPER